MRPAQRAVAGVHPQAAHAGAADVGDVGRRGRAQAGPEARVAAFGLGAGVADAGQHALDTFGQHAAARLRQRRVQRGVPARDLDGAGHAQLVAQAAHGDLDLVVDGGDEGRVLGLFQLEGGAVALAGVDGQVHAHLAQQRRAVGAAGHHHVVGHQALRHAGGGVAHVHGGDAAAGRLQPGHVMPVEELRAARRAQGGQLLGEDAGVAALVAGGVGAAHDAVVVAEGGLDGQQFLAAHHLAVDAEALHQLGGLAGLVEGGLVGVEVGDAALQPLVFDAGGAHHVLQCGVAVRAQGDELAHVALEGGVVALAQELQAPAPLLPVQLGAEQQRGVVAEHPLQQLGRCLAVRPRLAVAHRDLRRVGEAGFQGGIGLAVHHDDLVAALQQMPGGADADDAGAENERFHGPQCGATCRRIKAKLNSQRKHQEP